VSADISSAEAVERLGALHVRALFRVSDERSARAVAAKMVDRAHEIANMPDWECDVDVSVEWVAPDEPASPVELAAGEARPRHVDR
jgi:hypothetical protein